MEELKAGALYVAAVKVEFRTVVEVVVVSLLGLVAEVPGASVARVFFTDMAVVLVGLTVVVVVTRKVDSGEGPTLVVLGRPEEVALAVVPEPQPATAKLTARIRPRRNRKRTGAQQRRLPCLWNTIRILCSLRNSSRQTNDSSSTLIATCCPPETAITGAGEYTRPLNPRTPRFC